MKKGDKVWYVNSNGDKVRATITKVDSVNWITIKVDTEFLKHSNHEYKGGRVEVSSVDLIKPKPHNFF